MSGKDADRPQASAGEVLLLAAIGIDASYWNVIHVFTMYLRQGKIKSTLESSRDSALLAVEVFNKPRASFRTQTYITLMIIAWTRLLHAYFLKNRGEKHYYKEKGSTRYELVDGERKAWELTTCIKEYGELSSSCVSNLKFFIGLRNKIEHRHIDNKTFDMKIFGECQSLLYNYENEITKIFGAEYALHESLAFALQFSMLRSEEQQQSNKRVLSKEMSDLTGFIENFRSKITDEDYDSLEYSVKLIQIPKLSGGSRNDLAVEFLNWNKLSPEEKEEVSKVNAIIREKTVTRTAKNHDCIKAMAVVSKVQLKGYTDFNSYDLKLFCIMFKIRPYGNEIDDPFDTEGKFCLYDEVHKDYVYTSEWPEYIAYEIQTRVWKKHTWRAASRREAKFQICREWKDE